MSNKMKQNVASILAMSMALGGGNSMMFTGSGDDAFMLSNEPLLPIGVKPPNGCKEYFFKSDGCFSTGGENEEHFLKSETVFKCFAINVKSAQRKFNKFINSQVVS
jgi:hypothetical protein